MKKIGYTILLALMLACYGCGGDGDSGNTSSSGSDAKQKTSTPGTADEIQTGVQEASIDNSSTANYSGSKEGSDGTAGNATAVQESSASTTSNASAKKYEMNWKMSGTQLVVTAKGFSSEDIEDYTWKGRIITDEITSMISNGGVALSENDDGLTLRFNDYSMFQNEGEFGVVLKNGSEAEVTLQISPSFEESSSIGLCTKGGTSACGGYYDNQNPYPCCSNDSKKYGNQPDGNCTWYCWYRAHQTYRGWGIKLPGWGNAKNWASNAKKSGFPVKKNPRNYKEGYSIAVKTSGSYGHVVWVYDYNSKYLWVDEMNCDNKPGVAGFRQGVKYKRSYFNSYIYKK